MCFPKSQQAIFLFGYLCDRSSIRYEWNWKSGKYPRAKYNINAANDPQNQLAENFQFEGINYIHSQPHEYYIFAVWWSKV